MSTAEIERTLKKLLKFSKTPPQDRSKYPNMNRNYPGLRQSEIKQLIDIYWQAGVDFSDKDRPVVHFGPEVNEREYSELRSRNVNLCNRLYSLRVMRAANELSKEPASLEEFPAVIEAASKPHDPSGLADVDALSLASKTTGSSGSGASSPTDSASSTADSSPVERPASPADRLGDIR